MPKKNKVTMYTIAEEVGMSVAAVSRAFDPGSKLRPEKRQLIFETAKRLGYVPNKLASRLSGEPMRIGVLILSHVDAFSSEYAQGIRAAYAEYADYKITLDLRLLHASECTDEDACAVLDEFIENECEGVIVGGLCDARFLPALNRLAGAGIMLILLDSDLDGCLRSGVSMDDVETAGRMAAQLLSVAARNRDIAVFMASEDNIAQHALLGSFRAAAEKYGLNIVRMYNTKNNAQTASEQAAELLSGLPDIGGIYVSTANSAPICRCIAEAGLSGKIGIVTSDVFTELNGYIRRGTVFATIYQDPASQAKAAFEALFYCLSDKTAIPEFIYARPQAVFASNLNLYEKTIRK